ncbi:MAG: sulfatase-like hydrolase/transferase [Hungatella sp.]|jgi:arylsulfatase A-like enzyme|nr:sulfatase-like hydrolase/transferase [Hungatella sp.]
MNEKPNILWLTTDHHIFANHYDFQPEYEGRLKTLESLWEQGRRYNQAYTVCPLCTPARASMLTGLYPHKHGMLLNPDAKDPHQRKDFDDAEELFAASVKRSGYRVAQLGKWHVGNEKTPQDLGFEGWSPPGYGAPLRSAKYGEYLKDKCLPAPVVKVLWNASQPETAGKEFDLTELYNPFSAARELLTPKETHEAYFVADMACKWLDDYATSRSNQPFVLKVDVWGPHHPYDTAVPFKGTVNAALLKEHPSFSEKYWNKPANYALIKRYWDCISYMNWEQMSQVLAVSYEHAMLVDDAMGRIVNKLASLSLEQNTVVILTADHGDILSAHGGLFNKDALLVEETMKIPLAIKWPGKIEPGTVCEDLVTNMDIPATITSLCGAHPRYVMDGIDLLDGPRREHVMCETTGCYKREFVQRMLRWKNYKYIAHFEDMDELYDLNADPFELNNLIGNVEFSGVLSEMRRRLKREMMLLGDVHEEAGRILGQL